MNDMWQLFIISAFQLLLKNFNTHDKWWTSETNLSQQHIFEKQTMFLMTE